MSAPTLDLGNLLVHLKADASQYNRVFGGAAKTLSSFTRLVKWTGAAVIAYSAASIKAFASFDEAMTRSLAIMGDVSKNMRKQMEMVALTISKKSTVSAKDLGRAYFFLASAGLDVQQSMAALEPMMRFAVAGQFDMARATELATDAQSALGLKVRDAVKNRENLIRVTDTLVGANTLADATTEQFAEALATQAGSTMKAYKISLNEGVAVLAAYAEQGRKASDAGTLFSRMIRLTMQGFRDHRTAWQRLNIDIFDAQGNLRHLGDIINDLTDRLGNMSPRMKGVTLDLLGFQARSQQAILPLLGMGEAIKEWNVELNEMQKITKDVFERQMKSWTSQLKLLWNQITATAIAIGTKLAPNLEALNEWYKNNEATIARWALTTAAYMVFVKDIMVSFLQFMFTDWKAGLEFVKDISIKVFEEIAERIKEVMKEMVADIILAVDGLGAKIIDGVRKGWEESVQSFKNSWKDSFKEALGVMFETPEQTKERLGRPADVAFGSPEYWRGQLRQGGYTEDQIKKMFEKKPEAFVQERGRNYVFQIEKPKSVLESIAPPELMIKFDAATKKLRDNLAEIGMVAEKTGEAITTGVKQPLEGAAGAAEILGENFERFQMAMQEWADDAENIYVNLANVVSNAFDRLSRSLAQMVMKGKADFRVLAESVMADLLAMIIRAQLARAAMAIIPGLAQYFPGYIPATPAPVPVNAFTSPHGGPALPGLQHGGEILKTGLAVVHKGETYSGVGGVLNAPPNIIINNQSKQEMEQERPVSFDGENWVANIVIKKIASGGPMKDAIKGIRR